MKIQQSAAPFLLVLAILVIGIPYINKQLESATANKAVEIEVQELKPNLAETINTSSELKKP